MAAAGVPVPMPGPSPPARLGHLHALLATAGATVLGAAPHVLHHAGPLAGAAILGGAGGRLLFGGLGLAATVPMLRRLRRRTGSWRLPAALLGAMAVAFTASSLLVAPSLGEDGDTTKSAPTVLQPTPSGHESHH